MCYINQGFVYSASVRVLLYYINHLKKKVLCQSRFLLNYITKDIYCHVNWMFYCITSTMCFTVLHQVWLLLHQLFFFFYCTTPIRDCNVLHLSGFVLHQSGFLVCYINLGFYHLRLYCSTSIRGFIVLHQRLYCITSIKVFTALPQSEDLLYYINQCFFQLY